VWKACQNENYRKNRLSKDKIDKLKSIGFPLWKNKFEEDWNNTYNLLKKYKKTYGDCLVPRSNEILGLWVFTQRRARIRGKLSKDRIAKLNKIGFVWSINK